MSLFALGNMPMLIGFGAQLGNKTDLLVVPRSRKADGWAWTSQIADSTPFQADAVDSLPVGCVQVALAVLLTDQPDLTGSLAVIADEPHIPVLRVTANSQGNDCIGHPMDGSKLQHLIYKLLTALMNRGVKMIHLFPCAPNAACVQIGRAIEAIHPRVRVYNFVVGEPRYFVPRLDIAGGQLVPVVQEEMRRFHLAQAKDKA